jgi:hypothetical protein
MTAYFLGCKSSGLGKLFDEMRNPSAAVLRIRICIILPDSLIATFLMK